MYFVPYDYDLKWLNSTHDIYQSLTGKQELIIKKKLDHPIKASSACS